LSEARFVAATCARTRSSLMHNWAVPVTPESPTASAAGSGTYATGHASAPTYGLVVGLIWWIIGMLLAALYFVLIYRLFRGKVRLTEGDSGY
jgi:hypothetical protein